MNNKLEHFKFATIKNATIEVQETDDSIEIKIFPVNTEKVKATDKKIVINYSPMSHYERGDFQLIDNHKEVIIERSYAVATFDDVDWDCETIYPCLSCKNQRTYQDELRKENKSLREILRSIVGLMN